MSDILATGIVDTADVAYITGATIRTAQRWLAGEVAPRRHNSIRLLELKAVLDALAEVYRPDGAKLWLRSPVPMLGYEKPLDLIRDGDYRRVTAVLAALAEGVVA